MILRYIQLAIIFSINATIINANIDIFILLFQNESH